MFIYSRLCYLFPEKNILDISEICFGKFVGKMLAAFVKISILLLATCKSVSQLFNYKDYRFIVTPIALLSLIFSHIMVDSIKEYWKWTDKA
jgi:hypothetical protein